MKRQVISGLLALTTLTGCGGSSNSKEETSQPTELVYTDSQEIQDRFIINEGTGNVYVEDALTEDPNSVIASSLRNNEFKDSFTLRALDDITNIYVTHNPLLRGNSFTVDSLRDMETISNLYNRPSKVWIDEGHYGGDALPIILLNPVQIEGEGKNNTSIEPFIVGIQYMGVKDLTSIGEYFDYFGEDEAGSFLFYAGGELYDSIFTDLGAMGVSSGHDFTMSNVLFHNIDNPFHDTSFYFQEDDNSTRALSDIDISYTTFENLPIAMYVTKKANIGNVAVADKGNNTFRDVGTAIYYSSDNTEDSFAEGNYWAESLE
jgi:hypothetical protein